MKTSHLELHTKPLANAMLVEAHAHGTLGGDDYDSLLPELNALLEDGRRLNFLLFMDNFHGWDLESFARELKWDAKHRGQMGKVAVVGDQKWEEWAVSLSKLFLPGNVRYFMRDHAEEARAWVENGG